MDEEKYDWKMDDCPYKSLIFRSFWWLRKTFMRPYYFMMVRTKLHKISGLHEELAKSGRVDIFPFKGGGRGFMLVLYKKDALYFHQDGDHFAYDGCETGEYENGDVTIFDNIEK